MLHRCILFTPLSSSAVGMKFCVSMSCTRCHVLNCCGSAAFVHKFSVCGIFCYCHVFFVFYQYDLVSALHHVFAVPLTCCFSQTFLRSSKSLNPSRICTAACLLIHGDRTFLTTVCFFIWPHVKFCCSPSCCKKFVHAVAERLSCGPFDNVLINTLFDQCDMPGTSSQTPPLDRVRVSDDLLPLCACIPIVATLVHLFPGAFFL